MDNEALVDEEEVNILDLIANESEDGTDEYDDDPNIAFDDNIEMPTTIDGLKALVLKERAEKVREREIKEKRNSRLRVNKKSMSRQNDEMATMQKRMDAFEDKSLQPDNRAEEAEAIRLAQVEQEWQDRVVDDPSQAIGYANYKAELLEDRVARQFTAITEAHKAEIAKLKGEYDPDKLQYKAQIQKLQGDPNFEGLDEDTLFRVVKSLSGTKVKSPRGTLGGGRGGLQKLDQNPSPTEALKKMGFNIEG